MSAPLKIKLSSITHSFLKPTFACLASFLSRITFFVTNFPSLAWQRLQEHDVDSPWFSWRQSHRSILASEAASFSQGLLPSWTSSYFDVLFYRKPCITRSHFFVLYFCLVICCRKKMTRLKLKVVVYFSIFEKKKNEQRIGAHPSKNNYFAKKKPEIRRPFAFFFFKICIWWSFDWKRQAYAVCSLAVLMDRRVGTWNMMRKDTRDFHPFMSFILAIFLKISLCNFWSKKWVKL